MGRSEVELSTASESSFYSLTNKEFPQLTPSSWIVIGRWRYILSAVDVIENI